MCVGQNVLNKSIKMKNLFWQKKGKIKMSDVWDIFVELVSTVDFFFKIFCKIFWTIRPRFFNLIFLT